MSVVPVTINGVAFPKTKDANSKPFPVTIVGYAWITGLKPDNSPPVVVIPPDPPEEGKPPVIWGGGNEPFPTPPIEIPPDVEPPPEHPLDELLTLVAKEPPKDGGWGWFPEYGWIYSPGEGAATPKTPRR